MSDKKPKFIVIDIESTGLNHLTDKLHGIGVAYEEDETAYYSAANVPQRVVDLLADSSVDIVAHNCRFDIKFLLRAGYKVEGRFWDTKILASLVDENKPQGLKDLSERYFGREALQDKRDMDRACSHANVRHIGDLCRADLENPDHPYFETIAKYCREDCNNTYKLLYVLSKKLKDQNKAWKKLRGATKGPWDYFIEEAMPLEKILLGMEMRGIRVDTNVVEDLRMKLTQEQCNILSQLDSCTQSQQAAIEEKLTEQARTKRKSPKGKANVVSGSEKYKTKFMWTSNQHLGMLLFEQIGAPKNLVKRTKTGAYATNEHNLSVLRTLCSQDSLLVTVLRLLGQYKRLEKLLSTYIGEEKGLVSRIYEGRIYPLYLQVGRSKDSGVGGTVTGRLSSQDPNIQNIPRSSGIKQFFIPDTGKVFVYADYSQIELRIAAHLSKDKELLAGYKKGLDLHALTASKIFGKTIGKNDPERQVGKKINFAMIYDAGPFRLIEEIKDECGIEYSFEEMQHMRNAFFDLYSGYRDYLDEQKRILRRNEALISECGRVRRLPDIAYFRYLEWKGQRFNGPASARLRLLGSPNEQVSEKELFNRAKRKYTHNLKQGFNFPIQSLGSSIAKRAMLGLAGAGAEIVTQCHDAIIIQVDESKAQAAARAMQKIMENVYKLSVPLKAECKILRSFDESDPVK